MTGGSQIRGTWAQDNKNNTKMTNILLKIKNISSFYNFSRNAPKLTLTAINVGKKGGFVTFSYKRREWTNVIQAVFTNVH